MQLAEVLAHRRLLIRGALLGGLAASIAVFPRRLLELNERLVVATHLDWAWLQTTAFAGWILGLACLACVVVEIRRLIQAIAGRVVRNHHLIMVVGVILVAVAWLWPNMVWRSMSWVENRHLMESETES